MIFIRETHCGESDSDSDSQSDTPEEDCVRQERIYSAHPRCDKYNDECVFDADADEPGSITPEISAWCDMADGGAEGDLAAERGRIEAKAVAQLQDPRRVRWALGPPSGGLDSFVEDFHRRMRRLGRGPREMWQLLHSVREIVGVGATDGMGDELRRHFDLLACSCADEIANSLISGFEAVNELLPVCIGPFIGRLFEMASRDHCQGPNLTAVYESTQLLEKLMWSANCRHFFVPFENQLQLVVSRGPLSWREGILTCCVNLWPVLPHFVQNACDSFLSKLSGITESSFLNPLLSFVYGWDLLLLYAPKDAVVLLMQSNVTTLIISGLLRFCYRFSQLESSVDDLVWFIEDVLSTFNMLCYVDPLNGHKAVLQFAEEHIEGSNMFLEVVSALMIIPVIVTGGTVNENLVMKALMLACDEDSPPSLEVLFSLRRVFDMLRSATSIERLFEMALESHNQGRDGLLFHMLKFCAAKIRGFPLRTDVIHEEHREASLKRIDSSGTFLYAVGFYCRGALRHQMYVSTIRLDQRCIFARYMLILQTTQAEPCASSHCLSTLAEYCLISPNMVETNEEAVVSLLANVDVTDRRALLQNILNYPQPEKQRRSAPLLKALLKIVLQPLVPSEPRKLPRGLSSEPDSGNDHKVLQSSEITRSIEIVLKWLMRRLHLNEHTEQVRNLMILCQADPALATFGGTFSGTVLEWCVICGYSGSVKQLLPLCEPRHIPCDVLVRAFERNCADIADLLLCHGVSLPAYAVDSAGLLEVDRELVDARHPSVARFFNAAPTWDPRKHDLFPWWFKVRILRTVLLCWLRNTTNLCLESATSSGHCIGRLPRNTVHLILSFLSPVHWF